MSEETLSDLLERAADRTIVGTAPIESMLERNGQDKRRRTWGVALASAAAVVAMGLVAQGLSSDESPTQPPATTPTEYIDLEGTWAVTAIAQPNGQAAVPSGSGVAFMTFNDGQMTRDTRCNSMSRPYSQSGPRGENLRFEPVVSGGVACLNDPRLDSRLNDVRHVSGSAEVLRLEDADRAVIIELTLAEALPPKTSTTRPLPLEGATSASSPSNIEGVWLVTSMAQFVLPGELTGQWVVPAPLKLAFTDSSWRLESGDCMYGQGGYKFSGQEFSHVDPLEGSGSACPPEGYDDITNAENLLLRTTSIVTAERELRLVGKDGKEMLVAALWPVVDGVASNSLPGVYLAGRWELIDATINGAEQPLSPPNDLPILSLKDSLTGVATAGCRVVGVALIAEDGPLHIEVEGSPKQSSCFPQPTDPTDGKYFEALREVDSVVVDGDQMTLTGPDTELRFRVRQAQ